MAKSIEESKSFLQKMRKSIPANLFLLQEILKNSDRENAEANMDAWLKEHDYEISFSELIGELNEYLETNLNAYQGFYPLFIDRKDGPILRIQDGKAFLGDSEITRFTYAKGILGWKAQDGNPSSANLHFAMVNGTNTTLKKGDYIGPRCNGYYWKAEETRPVEPNTIAKHNTYTLEAAANNTENDSLDAWDGNYKVNFKAQGQQKTDQGPPFSIDAKTNPPVIRYMEIPLQEWTFSNNMLSWDAVSSDSSPVNDTSGRLLFMKDNKANQNIFYGRIWDRDTTEPTTRNVYGQIDDTNTNDNSSLLTNAWSGASVAAGVLTGLATIVATYFITKWQLKKQADLAIQNNSPDADEKQAKADDASQQADDIVDSTRNSVEMTTLNSSADNKTFPTSSVELSRISRDAVQDHIEKEEELERAQKNREQISEQRLEEGRKLEALQNEIRDASLQVEQAKDVEAKKEAEQILEQKKEEANVQEKEVIKAENEEIDAKKQEEEKKEEAKDSADFKEIVSV